MAIVVLVLWIATAAAGIGLLRTGGTALQAAVPAPAPSAAPQLAPVAAAPVPAAQVAAAQVAAAQAPARIGALPMTADGKPPPVPHTRVVTAAGERPLLEFSHPALAITGLAFWAMFTFVHYRPMAWIAFAVLIVTICLGLGWLARSRRARGPRSASWRFPAGLVALHGLSAAMTILLAVLTALLASR